MVTVIFLAPQYFLLLSKTLMQIIRIVGVFWNFAPEKRIRVSLDPDLKDLSLSPQEPILYCNCESFGKF
jgi:hypothetical protein